MMAFPQEFFVANLGAEIIYSFIVIVCSLMVYFGTKELYELSSHKGIKYFRMAFLFFAIAFFFRSFIKFLVVFLNVREIFEFSPMFLGPVTMFLFVYFGLMAVFYLLYSVMWKKWNGKTKMIYLHLVAIAVALASIFFRSMLFVLGINIFLFLLVLFIFYKAHKEFGRKKNTLYTVYLLLFIFWILNMIDMLLPMFLQQFQILMYLASSGVFLAILYKVLKKTG